MINYEKLQTNIINACQQAEAIQAVILVGSRARKDRPLDEHSDLDFILFTPEPEAVGQMPAWIRTIAAVWVPQYSFTGAGDPEWEVLYEGGFKADFTFHKIAPDQSLQSILEEVPYQQVLSRGFEVLVDKTESKGRISWTSPKGVKPGYPTEMEFEMAVDTFLVEATRAIRFVARADMWRAKMICDVNLKKLVLEMMEWQALAKKGPGHDVWYDGRYLNEWADPWVVMKLPETFGRYDPVDLGRALQATLILYDQLASETAVLLDYDYPTPGQKAALDWLRTF